MRRSVELDTDDVRILQGFRNCRGAGNSPKTKEDQLRPLGSSANNRWPVSQDAANLVRPPLAPCPITVQSDSKLRPIDHCAYRHHRDRHAERLLPLERWLAISASMSARPGAHCAAATFVARVRSRNVPSSGSTGQPADRLNSARRCSMSTILLAAVSAGDPLPGSGARVLERRQLVGRDRR